MKQFIISMSLLYSSSIFCGEVIQSNVSYKKGHYKASLEMQIEAPADNVYELFTDFNNLSQLSKNITSSHLLTDNPPKYIVEVKTHNCVLFFCKDLKQTQQVLELDNGHISVEDINGKSDFLYAKTLWHIREFEEETRISFSTEMKPDFWLPPLLGPWLFKKRMIKETQAMIERLEELAADED
jgi:hypothetical protein